jgi:large subunit ribosomal protein L3
MHGVIATKVGMSRVFLPTGDAVPVTYLKVEPNMIVRVKTKQKDGYDAVVLGTRKREWKSRNGKDQIRYRTEKEWQPESLDGLTVGASLTAAALPVETVVTVTGVSKGKGFQGVMKRHNFAGGPGSHGSHFKREPGSVGMRTDPGRIHKGKRMAGRMGGDKVTVHNCAVLSCDVTAGVVAVKGPVPGPNGSTVYLSIEKWPEGFELSSIMAAPVAQETKDEPKLEEKTEEVPVAEEKVEAQPETAPESTEAAPEAEKSDTPAA